MLALAFHVGKDRFALPCADVVEVVPRVQLRDVPHAPAHVAGIFTYRGAVVAVIDLNRLMWGQPCPDRLSSRIILIRQRDRVIGVLAERVTEAIHLDATTASSPGLTPAATPYLGDVLSDAGGMIQLVRAEQLVPDAERAMLTGGAGA